MTAWQFTLLGFPVRLAHPEYGALLPIGLLGLALGLLAARRKRLAFERLAPGRLLEHVLVGPSAGRALARSTLSWTALLLAAGALMQPQCGSHTELTKKFGIDVVIAIDASKSMLARDVKPSRIERAKLELSGLLDKIKGDRVGIVVFAGDAFVQCPMTTDYAAAKMFLRSVDTASMPVPGTDLGRALDTSRDLLMEADRGAKSRAIVLLSDGEDFGGDYSDSIKALNDDGIKVISVGIGSAAGEPIPELDKHGNVVGYAKDKEGNTVMTRLNESDLAAIADKTDGAYIASVPGSSAWALSPSSSIGFKSPSSRAGSRSRTKSASACSSRPRWPSCCWPPAYGPPDPLEGGRPSPPARCWAWRVPASGPRVPC